MSTVDPDIVRIAERRLHLVTDDEVQRLGLSPRTIRRRVEIGHLHRVLPGVLSTAAGPVRRVAARARAVPVDPRRRAVAPQRGGVLGDPTGAEGPRRRHGAARARGSSTDARSSTTATGCPTTTSSTSSTEPGSRRSRGRSSTSAACSTRPSHLSVIEDVRNKGLCTDAELGEVYHDLCGRGRRGSAAWQRLAALTERAGAADDVRARARAPGGAGRRRAARGRPAAPGHVAERPDGATSTSPTSTAALDIEVDHSEWHATPSAVEHDKARDLGLARARLGAPAVHRARASSAA